MLYYKFVATIVESGLNEQEQQFVYQAMRDWHPGRINLDQATQLLRKMQENEGIQDEEIEAIVGSGNYNAEPDFFLWRLFNSGTAAALDLTYRLTKYNISVTQAQMHMMNEKTGVLINKLSKEAGRPVSFMLYESVEQALKRPSLMVNPYE